MRHNLDILSQYLNTKFNLETFVIKENIINYEINKKNLILKYILIIIVIIYLNNIYITSIFIIYILFLLYSYYLYKIYKPIDIKECLINYNEYNTGDIIQSNLSEWYINNYTTFTTIYSIYIHTGMIIRFNNVNYFLHLFDSDFGYSNYTIKFKNNNNIEIMLLEDKIKYEKKFKYIYRVVKTDINIDYNNIFKTIKNNFNMNIKFTMFPLLRFKNLEEWYYKDKQRNNCCSFIFQLLEKMNIIPLFNYNNFIGDDIIFLKYLSYNSYNKIIYIKYT